MLSASCGHSTTWRLRHRVLQCGRELKIIVVIEDLVLIVRFLSYLGRPQRTPRGALQLIHKA